MGTWKDIQNPSATDEDNTTSQTGAANTGSQTVQDLEAAAALMGMSQDAQSPQDPPVSPTLQALQARQNPANPLVLESTDTVPYTDEERSYLAEILTEDTNAVSTMAQITIRFNARFNGAVLASMGRADGRPERSGISIRGQMFHPIVRPAHEAWMERRRQREGGNSN